MEKDKEGNISLDEMANLIKSVSTEVVRLIKQKLLNIEGSVDYRLGAAMTALTMVNGEFSCILGEVFQQNPREILERLKKETISVIEELERIANEKSTNR